LTDHVVSQPGDDESLAQLELNLRLRHAETMAHAGYAILDRNGKRIVRCSRKVAEILGTDPQQIIASKNGLVDFLAIEDRERRDSALAAAVASRNHIDEEFRLADPDSGVQSVREICESIRDGNGETLAWLSTLQDVSAGQPKNGAGRRREMALSQALRRTTLAEMTSAIAHDLNQPLTAITNYTSGCLRRLEAGQISHEEILEIMQLLRQQAQRASGIVRRVGSTVESNAYDKSVARVDAVTRSLLDSLGYLFADHRIALDLRLGTLLPPVRIAPLDLAQVLTSIIENAIEAMEDSEIVSRCLTITCQVKDDRNVAISVEDTGHGFTTESTATFFRPFVSTKTGGMGMGLAISKSIIEAHGGQITMARGDKQGAVVHILLPAFGESGDGGT